MSLGLTKTAKIHRLEFVAGDSECWRSRALKWGKATRRRVSPVQNWGQSFGLSFCFDEGEGPRP